MEIEDLRKETRCSKCKEPLHKECASKCMDCGEVLCDSCYLINEQLCDACKNKDTLDLNTPIRRSYIDLYKTCPYQYYLEVVKKLPTQVNPYALIGIDLHELFDKYSQKKVVDMNEMLKEYNELFSSYDDEVFKDADQKAMLYDRGTRSIEGFVSIDKEMPMPLASEVKLITSIGEELPPISTTIDRINECKGGLEIVDYKTGKAMSGKAFSRDLQVPLYIYGAQQEYDQTIQRFILHYLSEGKVRVFERENDDIYVCTTTRGAYPTSINETLKEVKSIFNKIKQKQFSIPDKIGYTACKFCPFHKKECSGADVQRWKNK